MDNIVGPAMAAMSSAEVGAVTLSVLMMKVMVKRTKLQGRQWL